MREISLTQGKVTLVDGEDYEWLLGWKWHAWREPKSGLFYAKSSILYDEKRRPISMARLLMNPAKGQLVDHRDRNTLNNQRLNLRICDYSENAMNKIHPRNGSHFRGVYFISDKLKKPFRTYLKFRGVHYQGGYHATAEEAALAYDKLVMKHCPDFGVLNHCPEFGPEYGFML